MMRLFRVAACTAATMCAVVPMVEAQEVSDPATAADTWASLKRKLKRKGFETDLEQFLNSCTDHLESGTGGEELDALLRGDVLKELTGLFGKKKKINDGSCLAACGKLCLALKDAPAYALLFDALDAYKEWEDLNRPAYRELASLVRDGKLSAEQEATLQKRVEATIADAPRQMRHVFEAVRALTADPDNDRSEWGVTLIADTAFGVAKKQARVDPGLLEAVAQMLGELWGTQPFLARRISVLLDLGKMGPPIDGLARDGLRRITFQNFGLDGEPMAEIKKFMDWWKDCEKAKGKGAADGEVLAFSLEGRRKVAADKGKEAELEVDVIRLVGSWNTPRFRWATPTLVSLFQWDAAKYQELRRNVVVTLRRIKDPAAADALLKLLGAANDPAAPTLDKVTEEAVLRTLGYLATKDRTDVIDRLRASLRKGNEVMTVRAAAAEALGRLGVSAAIDELLTFQVQAEGPRKRDALVAVAWLGTPEAAKRLLALWNETGDDERTHLLAAYGRFGQLPLPDGIAEHLLLQWGNVDSLDKKVLQQAYRDELIDAFLGGLADPDPSKPAEEQKRYRGVAHPKFLPLLRSVALDTDVKNKDRANRVLDALTQVNDVMTVSDVMFEALRHDDPDRRGVAARWVAANVKAEFRPNYLDMLTGQNLDQRILAAELLVKPAAWDAAAVYPKFIEVIRAEGPKGATEDKTARLIRAIIDGIRDRPSKANVRPLFELMDDQEGAWLNMQLHGVLFNWMSKSNAQQWALQLRGSRKIWAAFWDKYESKVKLLGDESEQPMAGPGGKPR